MKNPFFFGYGSLVNRRTHEYGVTHKARASGWRRAWRCSPLRKISYLTAVPAASDYVEGLIAEVPNADWTALDTRERAYRRIDASHDVSHEAGRILEVAIYAIAQSQHFAPGDDNPVLLSYIDVVVQGYLAEFGPEGVQHFFETTEGWQAPVLDDRAAPLYPRHQVLSSTERAYVDQGLARLRTRIIRP